MRRLAQDPREAAFVQSPYGFYARARSHGPLIWWEEYARPAAVSHALVNSILRDRRFGREAPEEFRQPVPGRLRPFYDIEAHSMLELEPPRQARLRGLVLRAFTSRRIAAMAPEIAALAQALAGNLPRGGVSFDLIERFAQPLPVIVIARLLGVPETMADTLLGWSHAMVAMYQAGRTETMETAAVQASSEFVDFLRRHVAEKRNRPGDDLITHLIAAEEDGARLSTDEMISTCILLLNAGHEATVHTLGNGVKALLEAQDAGPDVWARWLAPERVEATVEEILRFDPPLHVFERWVYEQVEMSGHVFDRGGRVLCVLGAAGHDPHSFDEPGRFWPERAGAAHLAFGAGVHFCLGAALARLELQLALPALFAAHPMLSFASQPQYAPIYGFHGLQELRLASH